jgi:hypothetical protein
MAIDRDRGKNHRIGAPMTCPPDGHRRGAVEAETQTRQQLVAREVV